MAVDARDGGIASAQFDVGNRRERYLRAVGGADAHVFEIAQGTPLGFRITDHDPNILGAPLYALHFLAIEGLARLTRQVVQGQSQLAALRKQRQLGFLLARAKRIGYVLNAVETRKLRAQLCRGIGQVVHIPALQADRYGVTDGESRARKRERHAVVDGSGQLAPAVRHVGDGRVAAFAQGKNRQHQFRRMALGSGSESAAQGLADGGEDMLDQRGSVRVGGVQFGLQLQGRCLDLPRGPGGLLDVDALRHFHPCDNAVALDRGHELDRDPVAQDKGKRDQQHADAERERRIPQFDDPIQRRPERVVGKALDTGSDASL